MGDWRKSVTKPISYTVANDVVRLQTTFVTIVAVLGIFVLLVLYTLLPSSSRSSLVDAQHDDHVHGLPYSPERYDRLCGDCIRSTPYNTIYPLTRPQKVMQRTSSESHVPTNGIRYRIGVIADLDLDSKSRSVKQRQELLQQQTLANSSSSSSSSNSKYWHSFLLKGYLTYYPHDDEPFVSIEWDGVDEKRTLKSSLSSSGRGMELSELIVFNGNLYSCDDRTGIVFQIRTGEEEESESSINDDVPVPWVILNDGNGKTGKGFKCEWMTVKHQMLYVGGFGKEWTSTTGELLNFDPQWIKRISTDGVVQHLNWREKFLAVSHAAGIYYPGYVIHESAAWSDHHKKWFFLPRRASSKTYSEVDDEQMGTNMLISTDESFSDVKIQRIGTIVPTLGFSSFKFIPDTDDRMIIALKTMEDAGNVATFVTVFSIDGTILLPDQRIGNENVKYEGIEFL